MPSTHDCVVSVFMFFYKLRSLHRTLLLSHLIGFKNVPFLLKLTKTSIDVDACNVRSVVRIGMVVDRLEDREKGRCMRRSLSWFSLLVCRREICSAVLRSDSLWRHKRDRLN